jgi:hypothetical protein
VAECRKHSVEMIHSRSSRTSISATPGAVEWLQEVQPRDSQWWYRVLTVQETVLARNIQVLLGPHTLSWNELTSLTRSHRLPGSAGDSITTLDDLRYYWQAHKQKQEAQGIKDEEEEDDQEDCEAGDMATKIAALRAVPSQSEGEGMV